MVNRIAKANTSIWRIQAGAIRKLALAIAALVIILLGCQDANKVSQHNWKVYRNPRYDFEFPYPGNWVAFPMPDNRDGRAFRDPNNPNSEIRGWAANNLSLRVSSPSSGVVYQGQHRLKVEASSLDFLQKSNSAPLTPQLWGESDSKSPRIGDALSLPKGGFRGRLRIYARGILDSTEPTPVKSQEQNFITEQGLTGNLKVEIGFDTSLMTLSLSQGKVLYNWQGQCKSEEFAAYYRSFYYIARQYRLPPVK